MSLPALAMTEARFKTRLARRAADALVISEAQFDLTIDRSK
jgi:hypothetical protein